MEQNESRNTVSADEKGRLKHCKFVFCRCNMYYLMHTVQKSNSICHLHVIGSMRNRIVLNSQIVSQIRLDTD